MLRNLRWGCCVGAMIVLTGCDVRDPNQMQARPVGNPPGIAPVGMDVMDAGKAAPANPAPAQAPAAPGAPMPGVAQAPVNPPPANDGKGIIGKSTNNVVDVQQAMSQNPNWKIVENKSGGDDPITFAASAYVAARSQASMLGFQAWLKQHKIVEERNPTYDEFMKAMKDNHVEFTMLYPWQTYGYDSKEGRIVILEDGVMKAERYKAAGIPNP